MQPLAPPPSPASTPLILLKGVSKRFGPLWANRSISLGLFESEIHGLVGENGAGKSTLMKILFGQISPDSGRIYFKGKPVSFAHPRSAMRMGIGMVHQQLLIFPQLTALENIVVGSEPSSLGRIMRREAERRVAALGELFGFDIPLDAPAGGLSFAHRQQVELLRVLYRGARILILDEPTSLLAPPEVERLLALLKSLRLQGHTVIFISHRLREVFSVSDRISILHRGQSAGTFAAAEITPEAVIQRILTGANGAPTDVKPAEEQPCGTPPEAAAPDGPPFLELRNVFHRSSEHEAGLEDFSLQLRRGEVLGIGGVVGNGQRALAHVLAGTRPASRGEIRLHGEPITSSGVAERAGMGFRWLPANPIEEALLPARPLWENVLLGRQRAKSCQSRGWLLREKIIRWAGELLRAHGVAYQDMEQPAGSLSGGNQQRTVLARVLEGSPSFVVLEQASRGLDIPAQRRLQQRIRDMSACGTTFLLLSYDLDELLAVSHRVGILYRGRLMGVVQNGAASLETLGRWMLGLSSGP